MLTIIIIAIFFPAAMFYAIKFKIKIKKLLNLQEKYKDIIDQNLITCTLDKEGNCQGVSWKSQELIGTIEREIRDKNFIDFIHEDFTEIMLTAFNKMKIDLTEGKNHKGRLKFKTVHGKKKKQKIRDFDLAYRAFPIKGDDENAELEAIFILFDNKADETQEEVTLKHNLTGFFNEKMIDEILEYECIKYRRYKNPFSVLMFNIDNMQSINDEFSYEKGDKVIKELAIRLKGITRSSDTYGIYEGNIILICPHTEIDFALIPAQKIKDFIAEQEFENDIKITASFSVVEFGDSFETSKEMMQVAKATLQKVKAIKKNKIGVYKELMKKNDKAIDIYGKPAISSVVKDLIEIEKINYKKQEEDLHKWTKATKKKAKTKSANTDV